MSTWKMQMRDPSEGLRMTAELGAWLVELRWPPGGDGGPTEVHVTPREGADPSEVARGITTGTLRSIALAEAMAKRQMRARRMETLSGALGRVTRVDSAAERIRKELAERPRPGRKGRDDLFYALVALIYVDHSKFRHAPSPVQAIASATGTDRRAAENWVRLARERGLLTESSPRMAGGDMTERARELVEEHLGR